MEVDYAEIHILFIAENLAVPFSRRTWEEAKTLKAKGSTVSVICPKMDGFLESHCEIEGINIYRHPSFEGNSVFGYVLEYFVAIFWHLVLSAKIFWRNRFHVIHGCNPPDLVFITALFYKLFRVKYVFDHHDVCPELYISKFNRKDVFYYFLCLLERLTFQTANYSIATNESYKNVAIKRGKMDSSNVRIVRSGPELSNFKIQEPILKYKKGKKFLVGYLGVISEIEGLDLLLESAAYLKERRNDIHFAILGGGTELKKIKNKCLKMGLTEDFDFYGRVDDTLFMEVLNTSDVCVNPDRPSEMTNISTMNKVMEYMALKKPIVQYTLKEGMVSAQEASLYAVNTDPIDFAKKIEFLLKDPALRLKMGNIGYKRIKEELSWEHEKNNLIGLYDKIISEL